MVQDEWVLDNAYVPTQNVTAEPRPRYDAWPPSYTSSDISQDESPRKRLTPKRHSLSGIVIKNNHQLLICRRRECFEKVKQYQNLEQIKSELGYHAFPTRAFNQDPLENFFGQLRQHGVRNINPSCTSFASNCTDDGCYGHLINIQRLVMNKNNHEDNEAWVLPCLPEHLQLPHPVESNAVRSINNWFSIVLHVIDGRSLPDPRAGRRDRHVALQRSVVVILEVRSRSRGAGPSSRQIVHQTRDPYQEEEEHEHDVEHDERVPRQESHHRTTTAPLLIPLLLLLLALWLPDDRLGNDKHTLHTITRLTITNDGQLTLTNSPDRRA
ncbi:hypothetical protein Trydic_g6705 [Trypoxylus dichotomus]